MWWAALIIGLPFCMWLLTLIPQECLWCGKKERLRGALLCSFCKMLGTRS